MRMRFRRLRLARRYVLPESPPDPRHVRTLPRGLQAAAQWKRLVKTFTMRFRGNVADAMGRIMTIGSAPCPRHVRTEPCRWPLRFVSDCCHGAQQSWSVAVRRGHRDCGWNNLAAVCRV